MDELLTYDNTKDGVGDLKSYFSKDVQLKNLGFRKQFLGVKLNCTDDQAVQIDQKGLADRLLRKAGMILSKPMGSPRIP